MIGGNESRASCAGGRVPPSFIHQVIIIIITGLNKLYDYNYVLSLKMALDADRV